jgi:hypothetical protein
MRSLEITAYVFGALLISHTAAAQTSIRFCENTNSGTMKVLEGNSCPSGWTLREWSPQATQPAQQGPAGPTGPQGPAGATGPAGPAGPGLGQIVDSLGQPVGTLSDPMNGTVFRMVGADPVIFPASPLGVSQTTITFYHHESNCGGDRYLFNFNFSGFVYFGEAVGHTLFYTRLVDPARTHTEQVLSQEIVAPNSDPNQIGACTNSGSPVPMTVGLATSTDLSSLVPPFKIQ